MCEVRKRDGGKCARLSQFHVHIRTVPQLIGYPVADTMETSPAGRSITACGQHVGAAVVQLSALPIRYHSALPTVALIHKREVKT